MHSTGSCPRCGIGTLSPQTVNETLTVGTNAVQVTVEADVCSYCAEHWYAPAATTVLDAAIKQLRDGNISQLVHIGEVYRAS